MSPNPDSTSRLCAAVIANMVKDAAGREEGDRLYALAWLASRQARIFFDGAGFTQSRALLNSPWRAWAYEALAEEAGRPEADVLRTTLTYLKDLERHSRGSD